MESGPVRVIASRCSAAVETDEDGVVELDVLGVDFISVQMVGSGLAVVAIREGELGRTQSDGRRSTLTRRGECPSTAVTEMECSLFSHGGAGNRTSVRRLQSAILNHTILSTG